MSKTTIPNGAANGATPSLAEMLPAFETDARFGEEQAEKVGGDPLVLQNFLFMFYDQDNVTASLRQEIYQIDRENERHKESVKQYRQEVDALRGSTQNFITERGRLVAERQNEIAHKRVEIRRIKGGDYTLLGTNAHPANRLAYWIAVVILLVLTAYLISFYASVVYNAFLLDPLALAARQAEAGSFSTVTITNVRAFPMAYNEYGLLGVVFLLSGAFVFITLGFLLYWFSHSKSSFWHYVLYFFTFLFDAFLAYEIVQKIHLSQSLVTEQQDWVFRMAFQNAEFYIILFAGFGIYLAWGLLLKYVLEEFHKILPAISGIKRRRAEISRLEQEIKETQAQFGEKIQGLTQKADEIEQREVGFFVHALEQNEARINSLREKLRNHLQSSGSSAQSLRVHITSFLTGWCKSIHGARPEEEAKTMVAECHKVVNNFYQTIGLN